MPAGGETPRRSASIADEILLPLALAAGVACVLANADPTGEPAVDAVLSGSFGALLAAALLRSDAWVTVLAATVAATLAGSRPTFALGVAALTLAITGAPPHRVALRAGAAALVPPLLLLLPERGPTATTAAIVGIVAVLAARGPVAVLDGVARRRLALGALGLLGLGVGAAGLGGVAALRAQSDLTAGIAQVRAALAAARAGDQDATTEAFARANRAFAAAESSLGAPWAAPARAVPIVAQHLRAARTVTAAGRDVTAAAAEATASADLDRLTLNGGRIDLEVLAAFAGPLAGFEDALDDAVERTEDVDAPWLIGPVSARLHAFADEAAEGLPDARRAALGVEAARTLLGGDGPRTYFVAFITPAEGRGLGGFMGNWAEVRAEDGALSLIASGRTEELRPPEGDPPWPLDLPPDYRARWGRFDPGFFVQDIPFSPDFPTVANLLSQVDAFARGVQIDGVIAVDPFALAGFLELTGPVQLEDADVELTPENAVDLLLRGQYAEFAGDTEERVDFLDEAVELVFEQLTTSDLPGPRRLAATLGDLVEDQRIRMFSNQATEQAFLRSVGIDGAFPRPTGGDFLAVTHQNAGQNKIDAYLDVDTVYAATLDRDSGSVQATATIVLENDAPATGLPPIVIHSFLDEDRPPDGTNRARLSVYSALTPVSATVDGVPVDIELDTELGWSTATLLVDVPAVSSVEVVLQLAGTLDLDDGYELVVADQPRVTSNHLDVAITATHRQTPTRTEGLVIDGNIWRASEDVRRSARYVVHW